MGSKPTRDNGIFAVSTDQDLELRIEVQEIHNRRSVVENSDCLPPVLYVALYRVVML